jgi:ABC-type multidrug transport system ATPase subunit
MLSIQLNNLGKKFNREWIFRNLNYSIEPNQKLLISGGNGSGKSTLLQVLSGFVTQNEGTLEYSLSSNGRISSDKIKDYVSFASPYLQLTEEFTPLELIDHIKIYKPFINNLSAAEVVEISGLSASKNKLIRQFSSGMKQRLKLAIAILSDTPLLLLDEPVSNLDKQAISWYRDLISTYTQNRTVIVCSNAIEDDHFFCTSELSIMDYKLRK